MKALALLALLPLTAHAAPNDGWSNFAASCDTEILPSWFPEVEKGKAWTDESVKNLAGLQHMTNVTCPAYLGKRNDADAIRAFSAEKAATVDVSPLVEREGNRLLAFLGAELAAQREAFLETGIDFFTTQCGQHMRATRQHMQARLARIQQTATALASRCFQHNDQLDEAAQARARADYNRRIPAGQPALAAPAGKQKQGVSDITGTREDKAKRAK